MGQGQALEGPLWFHIVSPLEIWYSIMRVALCKIVSDWKYCVTTPEIEFRREITEKK